MFKYNFIKAILAEKATKLSYRLYSVLTQIEVYIFGLELILN